MNRAEDLVRLLLRKKIISSELVEGLTQRIAQVPQGISADDFAKRLVEHKILTEALADSILKELDAASKPKAKPAPTPPLDDNPFTAIAPGSEAKTSDELFVVPSVFASKQNKFKKGPANPWESKLLLYGGSGVFTLVLLGCLLYFAIYRRGADEYMQAADAARDSGNYTAAIQDYSEFIKLFPNHPDASPATIRLALSKMRIIVDSKNDWPNALTVAKEEIAKITMEPDYRAEAQPELTAMLPTIAENLAEKAKNEKSEKLILLAEEAILLVQKYVPQSSQPLDRLQKAQLNIDFTKRDIAKDARLTAVNGEISNTLKDGKITAAYELAANLLREYPVLGDDARYTQILKSISTAEVSVVKYVEKSIRGETDEPSASDDSVRAIFAARKAESSAATKTERTLFAYAAGSVFSLKSTDGAILWKKSIGESPTISGLLPTIISLPVSETQEDALLIDYRTWELLRIDAKTGAVRFRFSVGEPFRLATFAENVPIQYVYLTTETGKLFRIDTNDGSSKGTLQFPQRMNVPPTVDMDGKRIFQVAYRTTLYVAPLSADDEKSVESVFLGHLPGTVRVPPVLLGDYLIIIEQISPTDSRINVHKFATGENQDADASPVKRIQTVSLKGLVETPPIVNQNRLFLATDIGGVYLYQSDNDTPESPLKLVAESTKTDGTETQATVDHGQVRYLGLFDQNLWVSGNELSFYDIQPSRNRLLPIQVLDPLTRTVAIPRRIENTVFRTFRYRGFDAVVMKAISFPEGKTIWETQIADPAVTEPVLDSTEKELRLVSQTGKLYKIALPDASQGKPAVYDQPKADIAAEKRGQPIISLVPLTGGFEVWLEKSGSNKSILVHDSNPDNPRQFRFIPLSDEIRSRPIALGPGLLTPLANGQVRLFDPKSGYPLAEPFVGRLTPTGVADWSSPVRLGTSQEFAILDRDSLTLHRIALIRESGKYAFKSLATVPGLLQRSDVVSLIGETVLVFSTANGTVQEVPLSMMLPGKTHELGSSITWGPFEVDELVLAIAGKRLYILKHDSTGSVSIRSTEIPTGSPIVGRPFLANDKVWIISSTGAICSCDPASGEITLEKETKIIPQTGPVILSDGRTIILGRDGCVYTISR